MSTFKSYADLYAARAAAEAIQDEDDGAALAALSGAVVVEVVEHVVPQRGICCNTLRAVEAAPTCMECGRAVGDDDAFCSIECQTDYDMDDED